MVPKAMSSRTTLQAESQRGGTLAVLAAAIACLAGGAAFVGTTQQGSRSRSPVALQVANTGGWSGAKLVIKRPKAQGFQPEDEVSPRELTPVFPRFSKQQEFFHRFVLQGHPVSEVFFCFVGKTPWRKVGEIVSTTGDFEEAVVAQWPMLIEHVYYLSKKARFWMPGEHPIRFGYSNEKAEIVMLERGPLPEGTRPRALREMLKRCGFLKEAKPVQWRHMATVAKDLYETKKDWHRKKPHLLHRKWNSYRAAHRWWNPDKYRGTYLHVMRKKRGLVVGQGPSR